MVSKQDNQPAQTPTGIRLHKKSRYLEIIYGNGDRYNLPFEYLREFSPAAEEKTNHTPSHPGSEQKDVNISAITPIGSYALQIAFDDGQETGIYSWARLYDMAINLQQDWEDREIADGSDATEDDHNTGERTITILYYNSLANRLGLDSETITLPGEIVTIGDLIPWLMTRRGEWARALAEKLKITVNRLAVGLQDRIRDDDEIALALVEQDTKR